MLFFHVLYLAMQAPPTCEDIVLKAMATSIMNYRDKSSFAHAVKSECEESSFGSSRASKLGGTVVVDGVPLNLSLSDRGSKIHKNVYCSRDMSWLDVRDIEFIESTALTPDALVAYRVCKNNNAVNVSYDPDPNKGTFDAYITYNGRLPSDSQSMNVVARGDAKCTAYVNNVALPTNTWTVKQYEQIRISCQIPAAQPKTEKCADGTEVTVGIPRSVGHAMISSSLLPDGTLKILGVREAQLTGNACKCGQISDVTVTTPTARRTGKPGCQQYGWSMFVDMTYLSSDPPAISDTTITGGLAEPAGVRDVRAGSPTSLGSNRWRFPVTFSTCHEAPHQGALAGTTGSLLNFKATCPTDGTSASPASAVPLPRRQLGPNE